MTTTKSDQIVNVVLVLAAVVSVTLLAFRGTRTDPESLTARIAGDSTWYESRWNDVLANAVLPVDSAPITIIEFMDVECPFCSRYHQVLNKISSEFEDRVRVGYVHVRIPGHSNALRGAIGVECAQRQDGLHSFLDVVYREQSEIGFIPWTEFAHRAGIADTALFAACLNSAEMRSLVEQSRKFSAEIEIRGTPSVIVNGTRFETYPDEDRLRTFIDSLLVVESTRAPR